MPCGRPGMAHGLREGTLLFTSLAWHAVAGAVVRLLLKMRLSVEDGSHQDAAQATCMAVTLLKQACTFLCPEAEQDSPIRESGVSKTLLVSKVPEEC
jgi:hypothetical protein